MNYTVSTIDKIDERFEFDQLQNYIKSIQLSLNGFSYILTDAHTREHLVLRSYDFGTVVSLQRLADIIDDLFANEELLSAAHAGINVAFVTRPWAMVPDMLLIKDRARQLIDLNFKKNEFSKLVLSQVPGTEIVFASRVPDTIANAFYKYDEQVEFYPHQAALVFNAMQTLYYNDFRTAFFMAVHEQFFDFLFIKDGKVFFYNNFHYRQYADILYFVMASMEKLNVDPGKAHIFLQGSDLVKEIIPYELKKHVRSIYIDKELPGIKYSYHFEDLPLYRYKLLTGIFSCAS